MANSPLLFVVRAITYLCKLAVCVVGRLHFNHIGGSSLNFIHITPKSMVFVVNKQPF